MTPLYRRHLGQCMLRTLHHHTLPLSTQKCFQSMQTGGLDNCIHKQYTIMIFTCMHAHLWHKPVMKVWVREKPEGEWIFCLWQLRHILMALACSSLWIPLVTIKYMTSHIAWTEKHIWPNLSLGAWFLAVTASPQAKQQTSQKCITHYVSWGFHLELLIWIPLVNKPLTNGFPH